MLPYPHEISSLVAVSAAWHNRLRLPPPVGCCLCCTCCICCVCCVCNCCVCCWCCCSNCQFLAGGAFCCVSWLMFLVLLLLELLALLVLLRHYALLLLLILLVELRIPRIRSGGSFGGPGSMIVLITPNVAGLMKDMVWSAKLLNCDALKQCCLLGRSSSSSASSFPGAWARTHVWTPSRCAPPGRQSFRNGPPRTYPRPVL